MRVEKAKIRPIHPRDTTHIDVDDPAGVLYWTEELEVSETVLRDLVKKHGTSTIAVRKALGQHLKIDAEAA